jgi:hypothetical protein
MPKKTETPREKCRRIHAEVEEMISVIAEREGLTLLPKSGTYTRDGSVTVKFEFKSSGDEEKEKESQRLDGRALGLPDGSIGKSFKSRGRTYTITEINLRRRKYPVGATRDDGKTFKFTSDVVLRELGVDNDTAPPKDPSDMTNAQLLAALQKRKSEMDNDSLFWDEKGRIACGRHAPMKGSDTWVHDEWSTIAAADVKELGGDCKCETCGHGGGVR